MHAQAPSVFDVAVLVRLTSRGSQCRSHVCMHLHTAQKRICKLLRSEQWQSGMVWLLAVLCVLTLPACMYFLYTNAYAAILASALPGHPLQLRRTPVGQSACVRASRGS